MSFLAALPDSIKSKIITGKMASGYMLSMLSENPMLDDDSGGGDADSDEEDMA